MMGKKKLCLIIIVFACCFCLFAESDWYIENQTDGFGDPTGRFSVRIDDLSGSFTNSQTSNGNLRYSIYISDNGWLYILLLENGIARNLTTTSSGLYYTNKDEQFRVQIKNDSDEIVTYKASLGKDENYKYDVLSVPTWTHDFRYDFINGTVLKIAISATNGSYSLGSIDISGVTAEMFFDRTLYDEALSLIEKGKYDEAFDRLKELKTTDSEAYEFFNAFSLISETRRKIDKYEVGDVGQAGYVFYDKGYYSDGWRYLEAAPADLKIVDEVPTVDKTTKGYSNGVSDFSFGYYKTSEYGDYLYVNGKTTYNKKNCTGTAIGTGKTNTQRLVSAMGNETYSSSFWSYAKTKNYAARLCDILTYTINGIIYDDWFLPSKDELNLIYENPSIGGFGIGNYWTSSEDSSNARYAWYQNVYRGEQESDERYGVGHGLQVHPIRAF